MLGRHADIILPPNFKRGFAHACGQISNPVIVPYYFYLKKIYCYLSFLFHTTTKAIRQSVE